MNQNKVTVAVTAVSVVCFALSAEYGDEKDLIFWGVSLLLCFGELNYQKLQLEDIQFV